MTVSSTTGVSNTTAGGASSATKTQSSATTNYNTFLELLVTELKNQDPTKPMDPTETVSQLATFSNVEQAIQSNSTLSSILANSSLSQASSLIGRTVASADGKTSGVVSSVTTISSGMTATLQGGGSVQLQSGVTIS
jgi:flagellar basal-body rod modification protein FlgD